mgnify:CR=1 FL=1|tara:strand:+ start:1799 stop:2092 length:294 start_codon:yes stop_codon:yes gene_type:complete
MSTGKIIIDMNDIMLNKDPENIWVLRSVLKRELYTASEPDDAINKILRELELVNTNEHMIYVFLRELGDSYILENLTQDQKDYISECDREIASKYII